MQSTSAYVDSLRPAGSKRSSKRDFIVDVFLRQDGHISADDLVEIIRREDARISRATVYRTLQWMVEAGIARKVDFGEGRYRFEHSYRHPRHFHLICKSCNSSSEFLSSDIEALIEEVASARGFSPRQSVVQIYGTCEACRTGRPATATEGQPELLFARDALRIAIATERSGRDFYTRAARITRDARARAVFLQARRRRRSSTSAGWKGRYRELLALDPELEARPTFLFFKGAANGLFSEGAGGAVARHQRSRGADARHPLRARLAPVLQEVRRALRGLGGQADLPRVRRRGARAPRAADPRVPRPGPARAASRGRPRRAAPPPRPGRQARLDPRVIDLHVHSTASDGTLAPEALASRLARDGVTTFSLCDHDTTAGLAAAAEGARAAGLGFLAGIEITAIEDGKDVHVLGYGIDPASAPLAAFLAEQRAPSTRPHRRHRGAAGRARRAGRRSSRTAARPVTTPAAPSDGRSWRARWSPPATSPRSPRPSIAT